MPNPTPNPEVPTEPDARLGPEAPTKRPRCNEVIAMNQPQILLSTPVPSTPVSCPCRARVHRFWAHSRAAAAFPGAVLICACCRRGYRRGYWVRDHRRWVPALALIAAMLTLSTDAGADRDRRHPEVTISPNAIQERDMPMTVELVGAPGETIHLLVLQSCDRNPATPELHSQTAQCQTPLWRTSVQLDAYGRRRTSILLSRDIPGALPNKRLWLRASSHRSGARAYQDAVFGWVGDPCSLWETFASVFRGNRCPMGAKRAVGPHRGAEELPDVPLEVRRMAVTWTATGTPSTGRPIPLPGTHNATGVAWQDANTLIVTIRRRESDALLLEPKRPGAAEPGLYRFDLRTGQRTLLVPAPPDHTFMAPIAMDQQRIAFMSQRIAAVPGGNRGTVLIWQDGKIVRQYPMRRTIHQMVYADPKGTYLVAYSRWRRTPSLLLIDLRTGELTNLGFTPHLYHAAMHAPSAPGAVLALEDNTNANGWDIVLVDDQGQLADELAVGPGHSFLPTWRPDGAELAYIGQSKGR